MRRHKQGRLGAGMVLGLFALGGMRPGQTGQVSAEEGPAKPSPEAQARAVLEQEAAARKRLREEIQTQVRAHLEAGKRLFKAFQYEAARAELERALSLDRGSAEARKWLIEVNDVLGRRRDRIKSAVQRLYGAQKIGIQERLVELDNRLDWGRRFIQQAQEDKELSLAGRIRRNEQALRAFERAREIIKWMPPEINIEEQGNQAVRLIRSTRKQIKALEVQLAERDRGEAARMAEARKEQERLFVQKKVDVMLDQARALFETGEYAKAEVLGAKILEVDPTNAEANAIQTTAQDRRHIAVRRWIDEETQNESLKQTEKVDRLLIPHVDYLIYPANWHEIAQRGGTSARQHAVPPWKQEIRKKLARRVSFEFTDTPLNEALQFLNSLTKVNIILDPKVAAEGAGKVPITLRVADMQMQTALKWILRLAGLEFDLRNQAVFITKKQNLASNVELEIYDVRDLTTTVPDFPGPRIDLGVQAGQQGALQNPFAQNQAAPATLGAADLATLIQERLLTADFADPATSIQESGGKLVVMQRPEVHDKIRELLQSFRETQTVQVLTQVRFIDVQEGFLEMIGVHFVGLDAAPGDPGIPFARVNPLRQPSRFGLFPIGGGPGLTPPLPGDTLPSPAFQFQNSVDPATGTFRPPFHFDVGPPSSNPGPRTPLLLRPRLDPNFPTRGNATFGPANAPVGFRRQNFERLFGSPTLIQGLTQNFVQTLAGGGALGNALTSNLSNQGAIFQFRYFQSVQISAVLQALRKDQSADTLLAPKLMQFNNQRAHIMVAQQRSFISDYDVSGAVFDPVIRSFLVGVVLDVKPTVSHDRKYITLDVRPGTATELTPPQIIFISNGLDVNNPLGNINLPIELPNIELRSISTTVTVPDNGTLLFSGLINDRKIDSKSGVPFFSDLPIIGRIFSNNLKQRERRNLLVLVNARVILFDEEEAKL